jgi:hypothetical protein
MSSIVFDPDTFRVLYPQFASSSAFPTPALQARFDLATAYVSSDIYGDMPPAARAQALNLMTAHLLAVGVLIAQNNYSGQVGVVTGATIDKVAITLQPPPDRGQWRWWLNATPYGAELVALLDMQSVGGFFVGGLPERLAFRRVGGGFGGVF